MSRIHGRNGRIYLGLASSTAVATPLPFFATWSMNFVTDKVDVTSSYGTGYYANSFSMMGGFGGSVSKKTQIMQDELRSFASLLLGMNVVQNYKRGSLLVQNSIEQNAEFFQTIFEIGRRFKIMNPDKMRETYGKLQYMLMDSVEPEVQELLQFK